MEVGEGMGRKRGGLRGGQEGDRKRKCWEECNEFSTTGEVVIEGGGGWGGDGDSGGPHGRKQKGESHKLKDCC